MIIFGNFCRWYHGLLDPYTATVMLNKFGKRGSFLIRQGMSDPNIFVISVRVNKSREPVAEVKHIQVSKVKYL